MGADRLEAKFGLIPSARRHSTAIQTIGVTHRSRCKNPDTLSHVRLNITTLLWKGNRLLVTPIFWDITQCSPLKVKRRFGGTYRLYL
jgi:hypothetical protein